MYFICMYLLLPGKVVLVSSVSRLDYFKMLGTTGIGYNVPLCVSPF